MRKINGTVRDLDGRSLFILQNRDVHGVMGPLVEADRAEDALSFRDFEGQTAVVYEIARVRRFRAESFGVWKEVSASDEFARIQADPRCYYPCFDPNCEDLYEKQLMEDNAGMSALEAAAHRLAAVNNGAKYEKDRETAYRARMNAERDRVNAEYDAERSRREGEVG